MDEQIKGGKHDAVEIKNNSENSDSVFDNLKREFFNINNWGKLFENTTCFQVTDKEGIDKYSKIQVGDLVKIKIPGPKNRVGNGFDWVQIKEISEDNKGDLSSFTLVLSPCARPGLPNKTAHFFTSLSKNYFFISITPHYITAEVHGRNEVPNYANLRITDKIRNFLIAKGDVFGIGKIQWETWTKGILNVSS